MADAHDPPESTPGPPSHALELHRSPDGTRFSGTCECGERFGPFRTAGMVHSAHAEHVAGLADQPG